MLTAGYLQYVNTSMVSINLDWFADPSEPYLCGENWFFDVFFPTFDLSPRTTHCRSPTQAVRCGERTGERCKEAVCWLRPSNSAHVGFVACAQSLYQWIAFVYTCIYTDATCVCIYTWHRDIYTICKDLCTRNVCNRCQVYQCAWLMPLPYCSSTSVPCVCIAVSMGTACSFQVPGDFGGILLLNHHFGWSQLRSLYLPGKVMHI